MPFCCSIHPSISKTNVALLLFLGFAGFSLLIAWCYKAMRRLVYRDSHSLDTVFDAGGQVTFSLTAVTVTSQLLWPADFLQSSTLMSKVSIVYSLGRSNEGVSNLKNNLKYYFELLDTDTSLPLHYWFICSSSFSTTYVYIARLFQSGLGGSLWYCIGIVVGILVFPCLSIFIKSRAPGAKTYPQVSL